MMNVLIGQSQKGTASPLHGYGSHIGAKSGEVTDFKSLMVQMTKKTVSVTSVTTVASQQSACLAVSHLISAEQISYLREKFDMVNMQWWNSEEFFNELEEMGITEGNLYVYEENHFLRSKTVIEYVEITIEQIELSISYFEGKASYASNIDEEDVIMLEELRRAWQNKTCLWELLMELIG